MSAAETAAREAGIAWADREAEALEGSPVGPWLSSALDARPLVEDLESTERFDPAAVCNAAAAARWADLVGMAEAEEHFAADAQARAVSPSIEGLVSIQDGASHRFAMAVDPAKRDAARAELEAARAAVRAHHMAANARLDAERVCAYGRVHHGGVPCSACTDS